MIRTLKIVGYKSFNEAIFELKNLTVLTGLNGSGKSTVIQSLRMLLESNGNNPYLKGHGDYGELHSKFSRVGKPIELEIFNNEAISIGKAVLSDVSSLVESSTSIICQYIGAERLGPQSTLPVPDDNNINIGHQGEYAADFFYKFQGCKVSKAMNHGMTVSSTLKSQLTSWMTEISPNVSFEFNHTKKHDTSYIEIEGHRATNTGFGISYALPIVLASLVMSSRECLDFEEEHARLWFERLKTDNLVLMIENPEAHLHPKGQTQMGIFLSLLSSCGVQVVVETHSDHFIDGVRIAVKEYKNVVSDEVTIKYFSRESNQPSKFVDISVNEDGSLDKWPEGFFDQMQTNLIRLSKKA